MKPPTRTAEDKIPLPLSGQDRLTSFFWSGDAIRSRSVGTRLLTGQLYLPEPPARVLADWDREIATRLFLEPGDVEQMPLARTQARWPEYRLCLRAMQSWMDALGLHEVLANSDIALMACRGARYHHDGAQYGSAAFCNLFLSEDKGLDVHFPATGHRIPLTRGTAMIFDTCQPHAVIRRHASGFQEADFASDQDLSQLFLTWELPIEEPGVARALGIVFDTEPSMARQVDDEQLWLNGARALVSPDCGRWERVV